MSWTPTQIKCAVLLKGATLRSLSLKAGLCIEACSQAIRVPFPAGEEAISKFLGIPACELWPDRFNEDGSRKTSRRNKYTKIHVRRQGLKRHAA